MPNVIFLSHAELCPDGLVGEVDPGTSILDIAHELHIEIESACDGVCACTTCHCVIREGFDSLNEAHE
ncbi:2Fe-2S iron-sulfur cluster-binding protein, partial [Pseudomonas syringae pv. tagetis]|uniref:2Fe-2S iron-sulfur cluster-binding protein n=1 Tax=Pseudomonas syringae group genomosp. 7 TaxID=251699 RepID=UPI00376FE27A